MKRLGKIVVCLASGLVLNAGTRAGDAVSPNNPYAPIVVRNIFGLNPPPPVDAAPPGDPPPKITLNGIMSIFDHQLQVLFKVAGTAKPGQPAKDESYILSEGQRQDEIEVTHINEKASLVTFNNHGTVQELLLVKANPPPVSTPTPTPAQGRPVPTQKSPAPNDQNNTTIPSRLGGGPAGGPGAARNRGRGDGSPLTTVPTRGGNQAGQGGRPLSLEEGELMTVTAKLKAQMNGDPTLAIYPPTSLDKEAGVPSNVAPSPAP
jgi:hypothetical protein